MKTKGVIIALALAFLVSSGSAFAQDSKKKQSGGLFSGSPLSWTVEPMVNQYVKQVTRHYNLNEDQETYTRQLLSQRTKRFLADHERDARSLLAEYWYYQRSGEIPTAEAAKDWAVRSEPLMAAMRKEIVDGNMSWREILTEDQRKLHDADLEIMKTQFGRFDEQMKRWREGDVKPGDLFGDRKKPTGTSVTRRYEDIWEYRVRSFIEAYNLDKGQQETARSILREMKDKAARYREKNKDKLASIENQLKALSTSGAKKTPADIEQAVKQRKKLQQSLAETYKPIREGMWQELLHRLERIPTDDQRQARAAYSERLNKRLGRDKKPDVASSQSRPAATTQPASK